jgi:hypothetical protein
MLFAIGRSIIVLVLHIVIMAINIVLRLGMFGGNGGMFRFNIDNPKYPKGLGGPGV